MRFSLRNLMIVIATFAIGIGIFVGRQNAHKREAILHAEIGYNSPVFGSYQGNAESFDKKFDRTTCLAIYHRYKSRTDWVGNRIASAAMFHLARLKTQEGLQLCREQLRAENRYRMGAAIKGVLCYFEVSDDIHFTQDIGACVKDGFDANSPDDIYLIGTLICSDFHYGNAPDEIIDSWPSTDKLIKAWLSPGQPLPESYCTYEDMIDCLSHFDPQVADHFGQIVTILRECNGRPNNDERERMGHHRREISNRLDPLIALRYAAEHAEYFARCKPDSHSASQ